ncbi:MAG: S24/S26 family peptidase [Clostridia bacterium]|nr:S24/S26 family peptidase [Clostridia bacterium]
MEKLTFTTAEINDDLQDVINSGGKLALGVTGGSMMPFLKHLRDTVFICNCSFEDIKCGQILLFKRKDGRIILHRVRRVYSDCKLLMNGDSQVWCEKIDFSQVIARVYEVERNGKRYRSDSFIFKLWAFLWFPTKPLRPFLFKILEKIKNICR